MNNTNLIGRLTTKPELRYTNSNKPVCTFTLAVTRMYSRDETDFINCVAWNKTAEILNKYCDKGSQIGITGRIQTRNYETQDGAKKYITEIIVENLTLLGNKKEDKAEVVEEKSDLFKEFADEVVIDDSELPF